MICDNLKKAYRKARAQYPRATAPRIRDIARQRLDTVARKRAAYEATEGSGDADLTPIPATTRAACDARSAYTRACLDAGLYGFSRYPESSDHVRDVRDASDIVDLRYTGWYADDHCDATIRGVVGSLTHGRFLAGWDHSDCDGGPWFDTSRIYDCERDAARAADSEAESVAESERERDAAYQARAEYEDAGDTLDTIRRETLQALRERRNVSGDAPTICALLRRVVARALRQRAELRERRAELALAYDHADGWMDY